VRSYNNAHAKTKKPFGSAFQLVSKTGNYVNKITVMGSTENFMNSPLGGIVTKYWGLLNCTLYFNIPFGWCHVFSNCFGYINTSLDSNFVDFGFEI
jgi:hypothetical protein